MTTIPEFRLYGENDAQIENAIQPALSLRTWGDLSKQEKGIALQQIINSGWINKYFPEGLRTIEYLNQQYLRECPGKRVHALGPKNGHGSGYYYTRMEAAEADFKDMLMNSKSDALVLRMLSKFAQCFIDANSYRNASAATEDAERKKHITAAFEKFDRLANCLNHIFEQFSVDQVVTRSGFVPRQDDMITREVYVPTMRALADPKWTAVSADLADMFTDYRAQNYAETITKAHSAVQRFLQILVGEEGKSGKGEVGKLFSKAKEDGIIPSNRFTDPIFAAIQGYISSERATRVWTHNLIQ